MKFRSIAVVLFLMANLSLVTCKALCADWQLLQGEHFLVYYLEDPAFAGEVLNAAEKYYRSIASDLGYERYDNFWQWEKRVKIYIYQNEEDFRTSAGIDKKWATGLADYKKKEIKSYRMNSGFLESLLPHEITHLIFRDFVGAKEDIPLWLDEGVAMREEDAKRKEAAVLVKDLIRKNTYIPIDRLMRMDVRRENETQAAQIFYAQSVTLVGFLIERYGGASLTAFYRELRDGKNMDEALSFVFTNRIANINDLERQWVEYYE